MFALGLLLFVIILAGVFFRTLAFEISVACLLLVPIESYLIGFIFPQQALIAGILLLANFGFATWLLRPSFRLQFKTRQQQLALLHQSAASLIWFALFIIIYSLCLWWPDFISMGERIRDYALLAEVIKYPTFPTEPWLPGEKLNYYIYWYRLGATLHQLTGLEIYQLYHGLQAVTFSLYIAAIYRILTKILGIVHYLAATYSALIGFGSNVAGLQYALDQTGQTWWGPSRVIKGAINEFPVWSFLLGDLHPHYLNLSLLLLLVIFIASFFTTDDSSRKNIVPLSALSILVFPLWIYNGNAWEVPVYALLIGFAVLVLITQMPIQSILGRLQLKLTKKELPALAIMALLAIVLYLMARKISPGSDPFRLVSDTIPLTTTTELFRHWGFQLSAIIAALLLRGSSWQCRLVIFFAVSLSIISPIALPLIILLLTLEGFDSFTQKRAITVASVALKTIGLTSLTLLVIPEIVFLDDPYGGENERMNTIFKAYSSNWAFLSIYAIGVLHEQAQNLISDKELAKFLAPLSACIITAVSMPFFFHTIGERKTNTPQHFTTEQGLTLLDQQYPGAGKTIQEFYKMPDGITLEAQGNPYSLTSHVSTLSGKRCYMGWQNHVDLLTRNYEESKRRAAVTQFIYTQATCEEVKDTLAKENIDYVVLGPIEKEKYGQNTVIPNCLSRIAGERGYAIYN